MMSFLKAVTGVVVLPLDIAHDVVTLGGAITDTKSKIVKRCEHIGENIDNMTKPEKEA